MDEMNQYRDVIVKVLGETAASLNRPANDSIQAQTIFDTATDRYLVLDVGWTDLKRIRAIVVYVRLVDGKVWVEEDWTEEGVATHFVAARIPKEQIVLGFKHPEMRPYTDFAVA